MKKDSSTKTTKSKVITALRNISAYILFILAGCLIAIATALLSIFISESTVYSGWKLPLYAMAVGGPALLCVTGIYLRQFRRWPRDIGFVFLLGWLLYLPYVLAGTVVFLNQDILSNVINKYSDMDMSFVEFSVINRIIWVLNLLIAIYFIRVDRKMRKSKCERTGT